MTPEVSSALSNVFYLIVGLVVIIIYLQWRWTKICRDNVQVLVVKSDGHGSYELAPQSGGSVSLKDPKSDTVRMWPINKLATIDVPYPSNGAVPAILQKQIRQVVVGEEDWEPLLNRSPYLHGVASPDVKTALLEISGLIPNPGVQERLATYASSLSAAPTREMIASPAVFGNLIHEKITEAVITVNKDMMRNLSQKPKTISPTMFYVCMGLVLVLLAVVTFQVVSVGQQFAEVSDGVALIRHSLGIP